MTTSTKPMSLRELLVLCERFTAKQRRQPKDLPRRRSDVRQLATQVNADQPAPALLAARIWSARK